MDIVISMAGIRKVVALLHIAFDGRFPSKKLSKEYCRWRVFIPLYLGSICSGKVRSL
jgi:hypothetical protein